jgi:hypothetical protein
MLLKIGRSSVFSMVNTMMMLMVAMIGPMEFSANKLRKNAREETVIMAKHA